MVRMSDVLKKLKQKAEQQKAAVPPAETKPSLPKEEAKASPPVSAEEGRGEEKTLRIAPLAMVKGKLLSRQESEAFYQQATDQTKKLLEDILLDKESIDAKAIEDLVGKFVDQLKLDNTALLELTFSSTTENYLYAHMVNVCLLSIEIGLGLGYRTEELTELGRAAFLHDLGMIKYKDIYDQKRKLTPEEYNQIKNHADLGVELLKKVKNNVEKLKKVIRDEHERVDGSGYPRGLKGDTIAEHAQIIGLVDMYEALTHPRTYRQAFPYEEALERLLAEKKSFNYRILKILIDHFAIYRLGCWVELNSGEIGKVTGRRPSQPFRPMVTVMYNEKHQKLSSEKTIDLTKHTALNIKKTLTQEEVKKIAGKSD